MAKLNFHQPLLQSSVSHDPSDFQANIPVCYNRSITRPSSIF